ncbi:hypothetical protein L345_03989, partial [Ophiophagus hannah]
MKKMRKTRKDTETHTEKIDFKKLLLHTDLKIFLPRRHAMFFLQYIYVWRNLSEISAINQFQHMLTSFPSVGKKKRPHLLSVQTKSKAKKYKYKYKYMSPGKFYVYKGKQCLECIYLFMCNLKGFKTLILKKTNDNKKTKMGNISMGDYTRKFQGYGLGWEVRPIKRRWQLKMEKETFFIVDKGQHPIAEDVIMANSYETKRMMKTFNIVSVPQNVIFSFVLRTFDHAKTQYFKLAKQNMKKIQIVGTHQYLEPPAEGGLSLPLLDFKEVGPLQILNSCCYYFCNPWLLSLEGSAIGQSCLLIEETDLVLSSKACFSISILLPSSGMLESHKAPDSYI